MPALTKLFSKSEDHFSCIRDDGVNEQDLTVSKQAGAHIVHSKMGTGDQPVQLCATTPPHLGLLEPNETRVYVAVAITSKNFSFELRLFYNHKHSETNAEIMH